MILGPLARSNLPFLTPPTGTIDRVTSFKLLGLHIDSSLSWANHTTMIIQKASSRLYFLKQLKRAHDTHHLLHFYIAVIRPVLEYCAPVWHYPLTKAQTQELESIQKRAIHITFHFTRGMPYSHMLAATNLTLLSSHRDDLSRHFFSVLPILHPVYIISSHPDLMQLHLGLDRTKFTQDHPPVQSDTVPSCNMAFLTTRTGLLTVNIHPSHFTHVGDFNY